MSAARENARAQVALWIQIELHEYTDRLAKADIDDDHHHHTTWTPDTQAWWDDLVAQYIHQAKILGLSTPLGKQRLLKGLTTLFEMAVTMALCEELPEPGHPSGELVTR